MKKLFLIVLVLTAFVSKAQSWFPIKSSSPTAARITLISSSDNETELKMDLDGFSYSSVSVGGKQAVEISLKNTTPLLQKGDPNLLKLTTSIIVPENTPMKAEILESNYVEWNNILIAPSKGNLSRSINPNNVPYEFSDVYTKNAFFPAQLAQLREPYVLRDFHGQTLIIHPFQYNPATKTLRIYYSMRIRLVPIIPTKRTIEMPPVMNEVYMPVYKRQFINYPSLSSKHTPLSETGKMLIISHPNFLEAMQPLVDWRNTIGIPTEIVNLANIGTTSSAIKNYVSNYYNTQGLTYLLLVGDAQFVPTNSLNSGHSDNAYGYLIGNDAYPEVITGRFSVETVAHTQTMVQRTIDYEKNPQSQTNWLNKAIGIASDQGPGDENEMDYEHIHNLLLDLMGFTYTANYEFYEGSQGSNDAPGDPTASMLANAINSGAGVVLYTGHGSSNAFLTTSFSTTNINNLTNIEKLPFIFSVACVNGDFVGKTCFAETWLRASLLGQPTGAIATLMSTINQSWDPPMAGQDEMIDILVESYQNNIKRSFGGISANGFMKMNDKYGSAGTEMTDTWTIFGDPALTLRTMTPSTITASHLPAIFTGLTQFQINCAITGAKATISKKGVYIAHTYIQNGLGNLSFPAAVAGDTLTLAISAFNHIPYLTEILVIVPTEPFMHVKSISVKDSQGNNNGKADYAEQIYLDVELENIGVDIAEGLFVTGTSLSPYITFNDSIEHVGNILASASSNQSHAFSLNVAAFLPDQHSSTLIFTIRDTNNTLWSSSVSLSLNAPNLLATKLTIKDTISGNANGKLEPGEIAALVVTTTNIGQASAQPASASLLESSVFSSISSNSYNTAAIPTNTSTDAVFLIQVDNAIPLGTAIALDFNIIAGDYSSSKTFYTSVGELCEDWETNTFTQFNWLNDPIKPWTTSSTSPFDGTYSARSGLSSADHGKKSDLSINIVSLQDDSISFSHKVSCESGGGSWYDYFEFLIDGQSQGKWDGSSGWRKAIFPVTKGSHTLTWRYEKDYYYSSGLDAAWIDNIKFPALASPALVAEHSLTTKMLVYPNPVRDFLSVNLIGDKQEDALLVLYNAHGQRIFSTTTADKDYFLLDMNHLESGVYFLHHSSPHKNSSLKIVKM